MALTISYGSKFSYNLKISLMYAANAVLMIVLPIVSEYLPHGSASFWGVIPLLGFLGLTVGIM